MFDTITDAVTEEGKQISEDFELTDLNTESDPQGSSPETQTDDTVKTEPEVAAESSTEAKQEDAPVNVIPFHEDPKIQEYVNRQVESRTSKIREEIEQSISTKFSPKEETNIPSWFGGDENAWKAYQADQSRIIEEAKTRAIAEIEARTQKEQERVKQANEWFEQSVKEIESTGLKVDKNKLLKTTLDYQLVDTQGRWNFKAAAEILKAQEPKVDTTDKKKLAASTTSQTKVEPKFKDYVTPEDLHNRGWHDF